MSRDLTWIDFFLVFAVRKAKQRFSPTNKRCPTLALCTSLSVTLGRPYSENKSPSGFFSTTSGVGRKLGNLISWKHAQSARFFMKTSSNQDYNFHKFKFLILQNLSTPFCSRNSTKIGMFPRNEHFVFRFRFPPHFGISNHRRRRDGDLFSEYGRPNSTL